MVRVQDEGGCRGRVWGGREGGKGGRGWKGAGGARCLARGGDRGAVAVRAAHVCLWAQALGQTAVTQGRGKDRSARLL